MDDLTWLAIIAALGATAFLYIRLLGGGADIGGEQGS